MKQLYAYHVNVEELHPKTVVVLVYNAHRFLVDELRTLFLHDSTPNVRRQY